MTYLERALELAERGRGTTKPNPIVGAVVVRDDEVVGEGWHERKGDAHAEVVALRAAGERAKGATLYVTLEPCAHQGATSPCADAVIEAGIVRVVAGQRDPFREVDGRGFERLRSAGVDVDVADGELGFRARQQLEAYRTRVSKGRPFVILKLALTLDGSVTLPGSRWVTGEESRRLVHELRAQVDAVAVGAGTARADDAKLTARGVGATRQPRRLAFGRADLPSGSELELRRGPLAHELQALSVEGVESLLLEGGPTIAAAFLEDDLVDKLLMFVAPVLAGVGATFAPTLSAPVPLARMTATPVGDDVLLTAYVHEP